MRQPGGEMMAQGDETMPYLAIDPITKKPKEYANSGEFFKELEAARPPTARKEPAKLSFADSQRRLRAETGLDLRSPEERQHDSLRQAVAEGVAEGLGKQSTKTRSLHAPQKEPHAIRFCQSETCPSLGARLMSPTDTRGRITRIGRTD